MATSSPSRNKGRKWRGKIKFWKAHGAGGGEFDRLDRSSYLTDEELDYCDDESKGIGTSCSSQYSSTLGSAGAPSKGSGEAPSAVNNSWSFQETFASVVQSIEEATEDAMSLREDVQQVLSDVVKSFDRGSDEEEKDSLAGESRQSFGIESDQISFSFGQNSVLEPTLPPVTHIRSASNTTASFDGVSRAVQAANGALAFSTTKSFTSGQGTSTSKSLSSSRSCHNSKTSSKSGLFSNLSKTSSHSTRTTEDLSPSVKLVTEVVNGFDDADQSGHEGQNSVSRIRSFGSMSLSSLLPGRKKKEKKSAEEKNKKQGASLGIRKKISNGGGDHTGTSSMKHDGRSSEIALRDRSELSSSTPQGKQLRQKIRRDAIVRELLGDDDKTFQSYDDETYDGTYDGTLGTLEDDDDDDDDQNIALQIMEQFDAFFSCNGVFQKNIDDAPHEVSDEEDNPAADQSCCGTASIFNVRHEEAPEEEEQTVRTFDDDTYDDGTFDDRTYDNGTVDTNTYYTDNGTYDNGTVGTNTYTYDAGTLEGTYDGIFDESLTLETATDDGTYDDTLDGESLEYEYQGNSFLNRPKFFGRTRSEPSEASSQADQSHIYMMMTKIRRQKSEIPKEITKSPTKDYKVATGHFQPSTSAFDSFKSPAQANKEPQSPAQLWGMGVLDLLPGAPSGWSETRDEPTTTNPNPNDVQKKWLKLIEESIQKQVGADNGPHSSRRKLKRRAAAEDVLQRMLQDATAKKKHAR